MKKPMSKKSEEMWKAIERLFPGTQAAIDDNACPMCHNPIEGFRDKLSEREWEISGLCQTCQDKVFP
jgi:hypothetical protein